MKHIKIEIRTTPKGKVGRIVEQTHRGIEFGRETKSYLHNEFELSSVGYPNSELNKLFVKGSYDYGADNSFKIPSELWLSKLRACVKAYNREFRYKKSDKVEVIE